MTLNKVRENKKSKKTLFYISKITLFYYFYFILIYVILQPKT